MGKPEILLDMVDIQKSFPGVKALDRVSFSCVEGEVHALVGENGAGKSTLMKILAGALQPDGGTIYFHGQPVRFHDPLSAQQHGISIIYQEFNLLPFLSVSENITLGREPHNRLGWIDQAERDRLARKALEQLDTPLPLSAPVYELSVAQQQIVEIAKAISQEAGLIVMDEPTAALSQPEVQRLFGVISSLKSRGITIIYVSHRMEEIFTIADRVTVLKDGGHVGTLPVAETDEAQIIKMMVGRELEQLYPPLGENGRREVLLESSGLCVGDQVQDVSFELKAGEIVGVAGLVGSGRTALARAIFGAEKITGGRLLLRGRTYHPASPASSIRSGFGFVTDDRKAEGLVLGLPLRENVALPSLGERQRLGFVNEKLERAVVNRTVGELQIQTPSLEKPVQYLSGGNQQKVVLGKWLSVQSTPEQLSGPEVILFDEPTRGIDVGAKSEVYNLMRRLADRGKAILMLSSELPEILGMSDRILVMRDGRLAGELSREEASQEAILTLAAGASTSARRSGSAEALLQASQVSRGERLRSWLAGNQGVITVYAVLILLYLFGLSASESFRSASNLFSILRQAVALGLVSIGQTLIILAGGIDLSVSSVVTLAALFGAGLIQGRVEMILPAVLLCLGVGVLFGLVNGSLWGYLGVEPFIVTLGTFSIGRGIALVFARGPVGWVPPLYQQFAYADIGPIPFAVIFFFAVLIAGILMLKKTILGRRIYAVGGNPEASRLSGIPVRRVRLLAFVLSGLTAAVTGLYMASRMGSGDPNIGPGFELDSITAVVVGGTVLGGGRGGLIGTLGGVLLVATLSNLLNLMNVDNWYQQVIKGLILLIAVAAYRNRET
jgi:ribose transport system ATP-binding protein/rhamnose transport system ATP-binding protein